VLPAPTKVAVCFVCLGNICRSPTAEGVFLGLVEAAGLSAQISVDSAGTGAWHAGEGPDARSAAEAARHGVALPSVARRVRVEDFEDFTLLVAMDQDNARALRALAPTPAAAEKIVMLRAFEPGNRALEAGQVPDVPDPYYGGEDGFAEVFEICERGAAGLLQHLRASFEL